jgi:hypothetical protein
MTRPWQNAYDGWDVDPAALHALLDLPCMSEQEIQEASYKYEPPRRSL